MIRHLDRLALKAFLEGTWHMFGKNWDKGSFKDLVPTGGADDFEPIISDEVYLGMQTRDQHGAIDAVGTGLSQVVALTTPGVVYSIQQDDGWKSIQQYANPQALLRYEVGAHRNIRYLSNVDQVLWNSGPITIQAPISEPVYPGSGAARNVDANRLVGQESLEHQDAKRYIQLDAASVSEADMAAFQVNDQITLHRVRMDASKARWTVSQVVDGVDPFEGTNVERRIVSIDAVNRRIAVDKPILSEYYTTVATGSSYGWITKAVNVHPTIFLTGPNNVVAGVTQSPQTYTPRPIDDFESFYRVSWDAYLKYQIWNDHAVEVSFNTGPYRLKGQRRY